MTEHERSHRAAEADRLSQEPLLNEALEKMERTMIDSMIEMPSTDHDKRYLAVCKLTVIRGFRAELKAAIMDGQDLARKRPAMP